MDILMVLNIAEIALIIALALYIVNLKNNLDKEREKTNKLLSASIVKPTSFDKDIVYLNSLIEQHFQYFIENHTETLKNRFKESLMRDEDTEEIVTLIVLDILSEISSDYRTLLSFYINDIEKYVSTKVLQAFTPFAVSINISKFK
jgi:hypothetical protein